jgi:hypothetical protein
VGYPDGVKGYRLLDPSTDRLIIECSVQFEETPLHAPLEPHAETFVPLPAPDISDDESTHSDHGSDLSSESDSEDDEQMMSMQMLSHHRCPSGHRPPYRQAGDLVGDPTDQRRMRSQFEDPPHALTTTEPVMPMHCYMVLASDLQTYAEAAGNPFWEATMQEEYNSLLENQTWDLVLLPSDRKLVRCRWVYRTKKATDGQVSRYKARLVAKGFQQIHGIDYDETFSPVAKMDSI